MADTDSDSIVLFVMGLYYFQYRSQYVCVPLAWLVPSEFRRESQISIRGVNDSCKLTCRFSILNLPSPWEHVFFSFIKFLLYFVCQPQFPFLSILPFHPPHLLYSPDPPQLIKEQASHGSQWSMPCQVEAGPRSSCCIKAGRGIPVWGVGFSKPGPDPTTRVPWNRPSNTVIYMQRA